MVVDGYAVIHYTEPRYTKDLDVLVEPSQTNARRVHAALTDFVGRLESIDPTTLAEPGLWLKLGRAPARIDILTSIRGVRFETAWRNRLKARYDDLRVNFISRRDLMRNKRAVARPQDLIDLDNLRLAGSS